MGAMVKAAKNVWKGLTEGPKPATAASMPTPEAAVPLPFQDGVASRQAALRQRAEASQRGGRDSTRLTERRLGDQGSPMARVGLAGSAVVTG